MRARSTRAHGADAGGLGGDVADTEEVELEGQEVTGAVGVEAVGDVVVWVALVVGAPEDFGS